MDIEVYVQRGEKHSSKNKERADIVVYKTTNSEKREQNADILGIVETKTNPQRGRKTIDELYVRFICVLGSMDEWRRDRVHISSSSNWRDKTRLRLSNSKKWRIVWRYRKISKKNLKPANNLKTVFRRLLSTLYTNTNISRREKLGNEMIRLIFCKIWDEKYGDTDSLPKFRVGFEENPKEVTKRIEYLFGEVKINWLQTVCLMKTRKSSWMINQSRMS